MVDDRRKTSNNNIPTWEKNYVFHKRCEKLTKNDKNVVTKDIATVLTLFGPSLMIRSPSSPVLWHSSFRQWNCESAELFHSWASFEEKCGHAAHADDTTLSRFFIHFNESSIVISSESPIKITCDQFSDTETEQQSRWWSHSRDTQMTGKKKRKHIFQWPTIKMFPG